MKFWIVSKKKQTFLFHPDFTILNLIGYPVGDEGANNISKALISNKTLTSITLYGNNIGVDGTKCISSVLNSNETLTSLDLGGNNIGVDGANYISNALISNKTLTSLLLHGNNIGVEGTKYISNALISNKTLTSLNLRRNNIGDEGAKYISNALISNRTLTSLLLHGNNIGDEGAKYISNALLSNMTLISLELGGNNITESYLKSIKELLTPESLAQRTEEANKKSQAAVSKQNTLEKDLSCIVEYGRSYRKKLRVSSIADLEQKLLEMFSLTPPIEIDYFDKNFNTYLVLDDYELVRDGIIIRLSKINQSLNQRNWYPDNLEWRQDSSDRFQIANLLYGSNLSNDIYQQLQPLLDQGHSINRIEIIKNGSLLVSFNSKIEFLEFGRQDSPLLNKTISDDGEKPAILNVLNSFFMKTDLQRVNVMRLWHGCSPDACYAICKGGARDLRRNDGGYFGAGVYLTPNANYAAGYSTGRLTGKSTPNLNGEFTLLLCLVAVGLTYPISRATDYDFPNSFSPWSISKYHCAYPIPPKAIKKAEQGNFSEVSEALKTRQDKALKDGFDSHFIAVSQSNKYQAVKAEDADFYELVVKEETQVLPFAVIYLK